MTWLMYRRELSPRRLHQTTTNRSCQTITSHILHAINAAAMKSGTFAVGKARLA